MEQVTVVGAGLAGCEAAWQLAQRGIPVRLCEMKPVKMTPAHHAPEFAELVCSNSLRGDRLENAVGLLKEELRRLDSLILACAEATRVEAGGALAVDRTGFSALVTEKIRSHPLITVETGEVTELPAPPVIIATGPLTSEALSQTIQTSLTPPRRWSPRRASTWITPGSPPGMTGAAPTISTAPWMPRPMPPLSGS